MAIKEYYLPIPSSSCGCLAVVDCAKRVVGIVVVGTSTYYSKNMFRLVTLLLKD